MRAQRAIDDNSSSTIVWPGRGAVSQFRCEASLLAEIVELSMSGYVRYPWGGVEIGGVLLGKRESEAVQIQSFLTANCEHHYGPAFDLSEKDYEAFAQLLVSAQTAEKQAGFTPIGWVHSVSRRDLGLSDHARELSQRFFPEPWQVAMIVRRSKDDPTRIGLFTRDLHGGLDLYSPAQEFTLDTLRQREASVAASEASVTEPDVAFPLAEDPLSEEATIATELPAHGAPDTPFGFPGLTADPFRAPPDAQFFYPSPQHREALAILSHRIRSRAGFLALLGAPGTGKSIVLECLTDLLRTRETQFGYLLNSRINAAEFFELIANDFHLRCASMTKTAVLIALNEYLLERSRAGQTTALVVDNAQKLAIEVLEEIELLGNLENRDGRLLQVVFAAQPDFERRLDAPQLRGLKQRLLLCARLERLDAIQTAAYVEHRMAKAGAKDQSVFPTAVLAEIHRRTRGVPRLINALCDRALNRCREFDVKIADLGESLEAPDEH